MEKRIPITAIVVAARLCARQVYSDIRIRLGKPVQISESTVQPAADNPASKNMLPWMKGNILATAHGDAVGNRYAARNYSFWPAAREEQIDRQAACRQT